MPHRIAISNLNASTLDIINTIRANAGLEYQSLVPEISDVRDIPAVGEVLYGYPALANQFINALVNRIALVKVKSATFNNAYAMLKKGYLEFGETVEEAFVNIAKAREFSVEKAEAREFKRTIPDVRTAFHAMNWRVQYPVTIQQEELRLAFLSANGVQDLIAKIVNAVYVAAEYDEFLLFKYLLIKAISHGKMYPIGVGETPKSAAEAFRGASNILTFMSDKYNSAGVTTATPKSAQHIFMDAIYNAKYDVNVLAGAFNMDKAEFMGKLQLIDDWTSFDNDRFDVIRANCDMLEEVTDEELALMHGVKAVLVDEEFFQIYDNQNKFTEKYVASGDYWNYFYNVWKTVSFSPFSNAIVFVDDTYNTEVDDDTITMSVTQKSENSGATILTFEHEGATRFADTVPEWLETSACIEADIAVHKYGAIIIPANASATKLSFKLGNVVFESSNTVGDTLDVGDTVTFTRVEGVPSYLSALALGTEVLTPTFSPYKYEYTVTASDDEAALSFTADEDADVTAKLNNVAVDSGDTLTFTAGANTLKIQVVGDTVRTYTVTINYSAS